jgi:sulfite exporter TauE/SafE
VALLALYLILRATNVLPDSFGVGPGTGLGAAVVLGLIASVSTCAAVTGSLVLAAASRYRLAHPEMTGRQRFRPHVYFDLGRVVGYAGFGALVGLVGSAITLSPAAAGVFTLAVGALMVVTGLNMIGSWPWLQRLQPRPPKWLSAKVFRMRGSGAWGVFLGGSLTFFLPCGFTQAMQLYVLTQGSALRGALLLGAFALGTTPGLLALGAAASFGSGRWQRYASAAAAVMVLSLGVFNFRAGWAAAGWPVPSLSRPSPAGQPAEAVARDGVQVVEMKVVGYEYEPAVFTVRAGVPVEWRIDGSDAAGCARVIVARGAGVQELLQPSGVTVVRFTPTRPGIIPFSCSMGMTTPGAQFLVI